MQTAQKEVRGRQTILQSVRTSWSAMRLQATNVVVEWRASTTAEGIDQECDQANAAFQEDCPNTFAATQRYDTAIALPFDAVCAILSRDLPRLNASYPGALRRLALLRWLRVHSHFAGRLLPDASTSTAHDSKRAVPDVFAVRNRHQDRAISFCERRSDPKRLDYIDV